MNRTSVDLVALEAIAGTEAPDLPLDSPLLLFEPGELELSIREGLEILGNECAHGAPALSGTDTGRTVDVV